MRRPLYVRMLRLRYVSPGGLLCFVYLEGAFGLGVLLALAELVTWWGVLVLPAVIALMVKLNDVMAGVAAVRSASSRSASGGAGDAVRRSLARRSAAAGTQPSHAGADDVYGVAVARGAADLRGAANSRAGLTAVYGAATRDDPRQVPASRAEAVRVPADRDAGPHNGAARVPATRIEAVRDEAACVPAAQDAAARVSAAQVEAAQVSAVQRGAARVEVASGGNGPAAGQSVRPPGAGAARVAGGPRFAGQRIDSSGPGAVYRASGETGAVDEGRESLSRDIGGAPLAGRGELGPGYEGFRVAPTGQSSLPGAPRDAVGLQRRPQDEMTWQPDHSRVDGEASPHPDPARRSDAAGPVSPSRSAGPIAPPDGGGLVHPSRGAGPVESARAAGPADQPRRPGLPSGRRPNDSYRLASQPERSTPSSRAPATGGAPAARRAADSGTHRFPDRPTRFGDDRPAHRRPADGGTTWPATGAGVYGRRAAEATGRHDSDLRTDDRFEAGAHSDTPQQRARQSGTRRYK